MLTLYSSLTSPYGRKVRIVADILEIADRIRVQHASTVEPADPLRQVNPLGKIPALVLEDGTALYDSRVIVDYLETRFGSGRVIPRETEARFRQLTLASLAEGINDALLLITYEGRFRTPEQASQVWLDHQYGKLRRGLSEVCTRLAAYDPPMIASVTLACALGYADWRGQIDWRREYPQLAGWLEDFETAVPAWRHTAV
ncbi:MAG: glutathione S-transferase family protein [Thalassobaculaceae bacterium]|nr:glutathione S-transferase family protein [Thalassobaculaceae bacterium]